MKKIFITAFLFQMLTSAFAQTTTVTDHRNRNDTSGGNITVTDHRILRDMSSSLAKPAFENMPVYRIQLRITTSANNGTDDPVWVSLNEDEHRFYLAKGIDNFKPGSKVTYDVIDADIKILADIRYIKFGVKGDDGPCFTKVELLINNLSSPVYSTQIVTNNGTCFDNNNGSVSPNLIISYNSLRNHPNWNYRSSRADIWRPCIKMSNEWITSLVEASIGNQIIQGGSKLKWGSHGGMLENNTLYGPAVEIKFKNDHTLSVDLDLERDITGPNPEADIDFELDFRCKDGIINMEVQNVKTSTDVVGDAQEFIRTTGFDLVSLGIGLFVAPAAATPITIGAWFTLRRAISFSIKLIPETPNVSHSCKQIVVTEGGDIELQ
ncbi:MAG TPA: hypothetical protein PLO99_00790 [Chitinophagaceae bacterium]|nr:hypothetical protein [Chitinophagaceae bacterium]